MVKRSVLIALFTLLLINLPIFAQSLSSNMKILEPLLNNWDGKLASPDGSQSWETTRGYNLLWDGSIVKITNSVPGINSYGEGYFYWDRQEKKVAIIVVNQKGIYQKGFVTVEDGLLTIKGKISFPEMTFDYKNTFEFTKDGKMIDRWFQNAFGGWKPGHVIEFTGVKSK